MCVLTPQLETSRSEGGSHRECSISVEDVTLRYDSVLVISGLSFRFDGPGLLQVIGPNGSGKTTLLKALAGILPIYGGKALVCGRDPRRASELGFIGYVPQFSASQLANVPITAMEIVLMDIILRSPRLRFRGSEVEEKAARALMQVGVPEAYWHKRFSELSGGLRQRVLIARAILGDPPILFLDEPLASVDPAGRHELACLIGGLSAKKTIVVTSHDPVIFLGWTKRILVLGYNKYLFGTPGEVLDEKRLESFYGSSVLRLGEHVHIYDAGCRP